MKPQFVKFSEIKGGDMMQKHVKNLRHANAVYVTMHGKKELMSVSDFKKMQNMDKYGMLRKPAVHHKPAGFFSAFFGLRK